MLLNQFKNFVNTRKILGLLLIMLLFSCKKEPAEKINEVNNLKKYIKEAKERNEFLITQLKGTKANLVEIKEGTKESMSKAYVNSFVTNTFILDGKKDFITRSYYIFNLSESNPIFRSLTNTWPISLCTYCPDKNFLFNIFTFNRSKKNIQLFFDDETITLIASFFQGNTIYEDSKAQKYVEGLLSAYESFEDTYEYDSYSDLEALYNEAVTDGLYTTKAKGIIERLGGTDSYAIGDDFIYSFWARRYHEKNMDVTYSVLKKIHQKITNSQTHTQDEEI